MEIWNKTHANAIGAFREKTERKIPENAEELRWGWTEMIWIYIYIGRVTELEKKAGGQVI